MPIEFTIQLLESTLKENDLSPEHIEEYLKLTKLCIDQNVFTFNGKIYTQNEGMAMGNGLSPFMSNLFLSHFETSLKKKLTHFPRIWKRYVDNNFAISDSRLGNFEEFLDIFNQQFPTINFTYEKESNCGLPFLDLYVSRNGDGLEFDIYRKPTNINQFIHETSNHHFQHKMAAYNHAIHRMKTLPLTNINFNKEKSLLKSIALSNGYKPEIIDIIVNKRPKVDVRNFTTLLPIEEQKQRVGMPYNKNLVEGLEKVFLKVGLTIAFKSMNTVKHLR